MLNLLKDIERSASHAQLLRARIATLTSELHAEEIKIAILVSQCIGIRETELREENTNTIIDYSKENT